MFLFLKLVLAHLIADFILQFEELYQLKVRSHLGHFFHALIHLIVSLLLAIPFILVYPWVAVYIFVLAVIHHFQDIVKYNLQSKYPKQIFWCFTIDQMGHFLFLTTAFFLPIANEVYGFPSWPTLNRIYLDPWMTLFLIAFITSTFKATYFLHALRLSFISGSRPLHFITSFEVAHALIERSWITAWILFAPLAVALPAALGIGVLRLGSPLLRNRTDFILSFVYAALVGFAFRPLLGRV